MRIYEPIIMGSDDDSFSILIELYEKGDDFLCIFWIKISCGLIAYNDIRIMDERTSYCRALEFSSGERLDKFIFLR